MYQCDCHYDGSHHLQSVVKLEECNQLKESWLDITRERVYKASETTKQKTNKVHPQMNWYELAIKDYQQIVLKICGKSCYIHLSGTDNAI